MLESQTSKLEIRVKGQAQDGFLGTRMHLQYNHVDSSLCADHLIFENVVSESHVQESSVNKTIAHFLKEAQ